MAPSMKLINTDTLTRKQRQQLARSPATVRDCGFKRGQEVGIAVYPANNRRGVERAISKCPFNHGNERAFLRCHYVARSELNRRRFITGHPKAFAIEHLRALGRDRETSSRSIPQNPVDKPGFSHKLQGHRPSPARVRIPGKR
jgi:hypothetical protein